MKLDDLRHVFKSSTCAPVDAKSYIVSLLNKFEVALTWDNRTLLIPSLLPNEEQLRTGLPGTDVRVSKCCHSLKLLHSYASKIQSLMFYL